MKKYATTLFLTTLVLNWHNVHADHGLTYQMAEDILNRTQTPQEMADEIPRLQTRLVSPFSHRERVLGSAQLTNLFLQHLHAPTNIHPAFTPLCALIDGDTSLQTIISLLSPEVRFPQALQDILYHVTLDLTDPQTNNQLVQLQNFMGVSKDWDATLQAAQSLLNEWDQVAPHIQLLDSRLPQDPQQILAMLQDPQQILAMLQDDPQQVLAMPQDPQQIIQMLPAATQSFARNLVDLINSFDINQIQTLINQFQTQSATETLNNLPWLIAHIDFNRLARESKDLLENLWMRHYAFSKEMLRSIVGHTGVPIDNLDHQLEAAEQSDGKTFENLLCLSVWDVFTHANDTPREDRINALLHVLFDSPETEITQALLRHQASVSFTHNIPAPPQQPTIEGSSDDETDEDM